MSKSTSKIMIHQNGASMLQLKERETNCRRSVPSATIRFALADSPLGRLLLAATDNGICAIRFGDDNLSLEEELRSEYRRAEMVRDDASLRSRTDAIVSYLEGGQRELDLPLDVPGTPFQKSVWRELQTIPYGATKSYGEVARAIGRPRAVRAVGQACGRNHVPLIVPCHRVLRGQGQLGGFSMGLDRKKYLLELEKSAAIVDVTP